MTPARFHQIGIIEGISFLILLLIAMPLKWAFGQPEMVAIVGRIHGGLWILYMVALLWLVAKYRLGLIGLIVGGMASVLPFGWVLFDRWRNANHPALASEG